MGITFFKVKGEKEEFYIFKYSESDLRRRLRFLEVTEYDLELVASHGQLNLYAVPISQVNHNNFDRLDTLTRILGDYRANRQDYTPVLSLDTKFEDFKLSEFAKKQDLNFQNLVKIVLAYHLKQNT